MSKLEEVQRLLASLAPEERPEAFGMVLREWAQLPTGVTKTPDVQGGSACIVRTRIPVWLLEGLRRRGMNDGELPAAYPSLDPQDLVSAWASVKAHPEEIDREIAEQEAA